MSEGTEKERRGGKEGVGKGTPRSQDRKQREEQTNISAWQEENDREADREQKNCPKENELNKGSLEKQTNKKKRHLDI